MPSIFDPTKYTQQQADSLINIPGQSLFDTNTPNQIKSVQANPGVITPNTLTNTQPFPLVQPYFSPPPTFPDIPSMSTLPGTLPNNMQIPGLNLKPGERLSPMVIETWPPTYTIIDSNGGTREFQPQWNPSDNPPSGAQMQYLNADGTPDEFAMTPNEQRESADISEIQDLNRQKIGRSAYQTEQDTKYGVDTAQANINDLTAQLTALKNEAAAIPLQMEKQASGKAVVGSIIGNQENERLRTNAIAALGVSTLLAASQGQLANAQAMAKKATDAKYDPIQERIDALKENLDLIIADPNTTLQEKKRAQAQKDIQDKKSEEVAKQKEESKEIWNVATDAASNTSSFKATPKYRTVTEALDAISKAKTKEEALKISIEAGLLTGSAVDTQIVQLDDGRDVVVDKQTGTIIKVIGGTTDPSYIPDPNNPGKFIKKTVPLKSRFTPTQLNKGAANAGVSSGDFSNFSEEGANAFINSKPSIDAKIKEIREGLKDGASPSEIEAAISVLSVPNEVKNYYVKYLKANAPTTVNKSSGNWFTNLFK